MWAECMQILPSLTWQGLLQHANPCFPLQTHPFQYHPPHTTLTILLNRSATPWMFAGLTWARARTLSNRKASLSKFVHVMSHNSCSLLNENMVSRHCVICRKDPRYQELLNGPCVWNQAYKVRRIRRWLHKFHGCMNTLCSYKHDLKIRITENLGPHGTVVPVQRRNNTAKIIMRKFTNGVVRL